MLKKLLNSLDTIRRRQTYSILLMMVIVSVLELLSIGSVMPLLSALSDPNYFLQVQYLIKFYDFFGVDSSRKAMTLFLGIFVFLNLLTGLFRWHLLRMQVRLSYAIGINFSVRIFKYAIYLPYAEHVNQNSSEIISIISQKISIVVDRVVFPLLTIISSTLILLLMIGVACLTNPAISFTVIILFGIVYSVIGFSLKKILWKNSDLINKESNRAIKIVQEALGGIRDVLIEGNQPIVLAKYKKTDEALRSAQGNIHLMSIGPRFLLEVLGAFMVAVFAYNMALSNEGLVGAIPLMGLLVMATQRLLPLLQQIYHNWAYIKGSVDVLQDVMAKLEISNSSGAGYNSKGRNIPFNSSIKLDNVSFRYRGAGKDVLSNISMEISRGDRIGFIGETGGGKSTLLDIIMGLLHPSGGKVYIDDIELKESDAGKWMENIAHVPQSIYLSDITIMENIAFGVPLSEIDINKVKWAAEKAKISENINSLDLGYLTVVGENGVRLSGGERQRLGIARAMYKSKKLLILDEATSALDESTEMEIMRSIEEMQADVTVLIIAHRLSTLKRCNRVFEINSQGLREIAADSVGRLTNNIGASQMKVG